MISGITSNANFDRTEMAKKMFTKLDANQDGGIDVTELAQMSKNGQGPSAEEILARWDANEDGKIDESENKTAIESMPAGPPPDGVRGTQSANGKSQLFSKLMEEFDSDGNGEISSSEFEMIQSQMKLGSTYSQDGSSSSGNSDSLIDMLA